MEDMLLYDPKLRPTAEQCLTYPYFQEGNVIPPPMPGATAASLQASNASNTTAGAGGGGAFRSAAAALGPEGGVESGLSDRFSSFSSLLLRIFHFPVLFSVCLSSIFSFRLSFSHAALSLCLSF